MTSEIKRRFTDTEMQTARETDLPELLTHLGYQVKRIGRYHTTAEMDSLRIKDRRTWFRYSQGIGGDAITFLQHFCNQSFPEAVEYLLTFQGRPRDAPVKTKPVTKQDEPPKEFALPPRNADDRRVFAYGNLRVDKIDADSGASLAGATVEIKHIESGVTQTGKTDLGGSVYFDKLKPGAYQVREVSAPGGYVKDDQTYTVNVTSGTETSFVLKDQAKPGLIITKYDEQTHEVLPDVTFEVTRDTVLIGSFSTDEMGQIRLTDLQPGTYLVKEVSTSAGYVLDSTPQQIELTAGGGIKTLTFFNTVKPGIHIIKVDSRTIEPLTNVKFRISLVGGTFSKEYVTDENGEIDLTALEPGAYTVEEITAPNGYLMDDDKRVIQINAGENARFVFTNTEKPVLSVVKYDAENDTYLAGATFRIAKIEDGSHYLDRVTDTNGRISISDLEPGVYSVKEIAAPSGYVLNDTEYHVELFPGKDSTLVVNNEKKPNLKIVKTDAVTGAPLASVTFTVNKADSSTLTTVKTDANGEALLTALDPGVYVVRETSVPDGYLLDSEPQTITLVPNKTGTVRFRNYPKPTLTIDKVDSITKDPIKGAKFHITYASNNSFTGELNDLGTYFTDENGQIKLTKLRDGWYRVTEVESAAGYAIKDPATQDCFIQAGTGKVLTFENTPLSALIIKKVDADSGTMLQGAKFRVRYLGGTSGTGGTVIGEYTTSANGTIVITGLKAGIYVVEETKAPTGYEIDDTPQTVYLSGKEQDVVTVEFSNGKHGDLIIDKIDSVTKQPLPGAQFKITNSDGSFVGNYGGTVTSNGIYTTDSNGQIKLVNLKPDTYVVTEIKAPDGYVLDSTSQTVKVDRNDTQTLTFTNTPIGGGQIIKVDADSGKRIKGVQFEIAKMNGERIGTYTTDSNGIITLPQLADGWYTATEIKAAKGYLLDSTPHNFEVKAGRTTSLTVENTQASSMLIHKIDSVTGKGIYGVTFLVSDSKGNPIGQYTSDQNGYVYIDKTLTDGKYLVREIQAADGYVLDTTVRTFYVEYGGTSTITWKNTPITGQIQIVKKSADYNPTNGLPAGTLLEGAVFEITDKAGNVVDTIRSNSRGLAVSKQLPLSRYFVREIKAPEHYGILMQPNSIPQTCRTSTSSAEDSLARHFLRLAADGALPTPEALSSLRSPDWLKPNDLRICCLKMFPAFYRTTKGKPFRSSSPHWMTWGIMSNGLCLTANVLESRNQDEGCSLSAILIPDAPEKYYLSSAQVEKLLYKSSEGRKAPVSMAQTE